MPLSPRSCFQLGSILTGWLRMQPRSFRRDAATIMTAFGPPIVVSGDEYMPVSGPGLLVTNHYTRPGFGVWWMALGLSSRAPVELHWVVTSAWTFAGRWPARLLTPLTRWALRRLAFTYGFSLMPPMPPDPAESAARAAAIRGVIAFARRSEVALVALAPEGRDFPGGCLGFPPPGAGRFARHLASILGPVYPAGVYDEGGALHLNFGAPFRLDLDPGLAPPAADRAASRMLMESIARLLPPHLRGEFA